MNRNQNKKKYGPRGSYTLETAVVLPILVGAFVCILLFFRMLEIQTMVQKSLIYAARRTAVEASADTQNELIDFAAAEVFFRKDLGNQEWIEKYVENGRLGIHLLESDVSGDEVVLTAHYRVKMPVGFFAVRGIEIRQTSSSRKWIGNTDANKDAEDGEWVYITPTGEAYHLTEKCTYLDLSIREVSATSVTSAKNSNGERYRKCNKCGEINADTDLCYVTNYGDCYHTSLSCSALKRTVYRVKKETVPERKLCSRCKKSDAAE